jgi:hypothetical protein
MTDDDSIEEVGSVCKTDRGRTSEAIPELRSVCFIFRVRDYEPNGTYLFIPLLFFQLQNKLQARSQSNDLKYDETRTSSNVGSRREDLLLQNDPMFGIPTVRMNFIHCHDVAFTPGRSPPKIIASTGMSGIPRNGMRT